ncbi:MAG: sugar ABC transporter permease [Oscillospiraceae bacterium]|jgi:multiple sugar transport system permease protein|nr:sugar ABC transporter permease [Oscillospiraceae bacterium]
MLAPLLLGIVAFFLVPFAILLRYSVTTGLGGSAYVGFENYIRVFTNETFLLAFGNTARFFAIGVSLNMVLAFLIAHTLRRRFLGSTLARSVILFPMFLPVAAVVTVSALLFFGDGLVNRALELFGLSAVDWLGSGAAFGFMLGLYIFKSIGYNVVLMLAGMQMIPREMYESADMDGATELQKLFGITVPMLVPTLFFTFIISVMNCFRSFRETFILGGTHPHSSIYMLPHFINNNTRNLNYQRLATASVITLCAIAVITAVVYALEARWEEKT